MEAVRSVLCQTHQPLEIIVIDDGSTDGTAETLHLIDPILRVVKQGNQGPSAARNRGLREVKGDWIAFLDSDDIWHADRLEKQLQLQMKHPELDFIFSDVRVEQPDRTIHSFIAQKRNRAYLRCHASCLSETFPRLLGENFIATPTVLIRRKLVEKIGYFDESLRSVEDREYWLRAAYVGRVGYVDQVLVTTRVCGDNLGQEKHLRATNLVEVLQRWRARARDEDAPVPLDALARAEAIAYSLLALSEYRRGEHRRSLRSFRCAFRYGWRKPGYYWHLAGAAFGVVRAKTETTTDHE